MSRTQTQSRTQTNSDERSRGKQKSEVWWYNESLKRQPDKEGGGDRAGQGSKYAKVTTLNDLSQTQADSGRDETHHEPQFREMGKSWNGTERHRTSSANSRPVHLNGNDSSSAEPASSLSRPRRSSMDNTQRRYIAAQDFTPPYDNRHMFHTPILPGRHMRSEVENRLSDCTKEKRNITDLLNRTVEKLEAANTRTEELEAQVKSLAEELEAMTGKFQETESRRRKTAHLLQETVSELHGANYFLTQTDARAQRDVISMVDTLNIETMQISALIADGLGELSRGKEPEKIPNVDERNFNRRAVGNSLIQYLEREEDQSIDPMAVQLALQFCLAETCYVVVESWRPGKWRDEEILFEIYASMKKTELQPIFGRWRALTRAQTNYQENHAKVKSYFYRRAQDVLSLAGWPSHIPENREFLGRFKDRIEFLATRSLRLHKAVSEDMTSGELRVKIIYPEEKFDRESIDQAFPDENYEMSNPNDSQLEAALGTTDIGLVRAVGAELRTLRKPKIVLLSALHALLYKN